MADILALNKIAKVGLDILDGYNISDNAENPEGIILRSFAMHDYEMKDNLLAIARAGAGVNNIPVDKCSEQGIVVFNTPGANANAVKELVIAGLLLSSRKIYDGISWVQSLKGEEGVAKLVEKGKSAYVGPEIEGKTLGVLGLGAIGVMVANVAVSLGMEVIGYDPYISIDNAWGLSRAVKKAKSADEIYANADYLTMHVPLTDKTKNQINKDTIAQMKDGVRILNFSRGGLVNDDDIIAACESGKVSAYVTDFPDENLLGIQNIITIPHLGASTPESEDNCAVMAARELKEYIENGNIVNSVNFPSVNLERDEGTRICVLHKNVPNMISQISNIPAAKNINIIHLVNKSKGDMAYTVLDIDGDACEQVAAELKAIEGVIRIRIIT